MKIIKSGEWKQRMVCRGCSSIIEIEMNDILFEQQMQEDESFGLGFYILCPVCSRKIVLNNLPDKIKEEVTTRGC